MLLREIDREAMPPLLIRIGHLQPVETADCVDHGKAQPRRTLLLRSLIEPVEDTPGVERTARTAVADREATRSDAHRPRRRERMRFSAGWRPRSRPATDSSAP